ncbi:unnamed protein product [Rhizophagus irregularis]|nr:unnamed protein product [Rhizophagus irregularis]
MLPHNFEEQALITTRRSSNNLISPSQLLRRFGGTKINDATDEIKDVFGNSPVRKHIHIIIGQPTIVQLTTTTRALNQETQSLANEYNGRSLFSDNLFSNHKV